MSSAQDAQRLDEYVHSVLSFSARLQQQVADAEHGTIVDMASLVAGVFEKGGKMLLCGNGGSAADAQHLATELSIRYRSSVQRKALAAIALNADTTALTAGANDLGYDEVFRRLVEAYGSPGDVLLGISTSGNSMNVYKALEYGRAHGLHTLAFLGGDGGRIASVADLKVIVPFSGAADRVQECHIAVGHVLIDCVERIMGFVAGNC
ncbi:SIS domain-containing protein [Prosthecochloris sp. HL-130-GSB]|jgi:D-sedoheptulose 7-phosphate isomerase|uniref:Phosphoheptose isomerase n=1 Tax=Prosthecochloris aestuarii TaxID=1102 RepID=A0A831WU61_PROAE|nr:SIS domain-containing protein [Prosthecochloris sp. HL-130-GSB]ARM30187.1 phosphoheptose isomerase [Prosthecochloris sp. HL-130-GSB]MBO8091783.1 SIS domain-containing protein [Prosthecochloris sp.]HED30401.1 SIS domain-containing protein [Prosthecochloris aestuarii]